MDHEIYSSACQIVNFSNVCFEPLSADRIVAKGAQPAAQSAPKELLRLVPKVSKLMGVQTCYFCAKVL